MERRLCLQRMYEHRELAITPKNTKKKPPPIPTGRISEAFAYYYSLLADRSLQKVADKFGLSIATIKSWSSRYKWRAKVLKMDLEVAERVRDKLMDQAANRTVENLKIIDRLRVRFMGMLDRALMVEDEDGKPIKINEDQAKSIIESIDDYARLVKLELLLMEKPTEITEEQGKFVVISAVPSSKPEDPE